MGSRLELHALLISTSGLSHVYFQPPENISLEYPCILYNRDYIKTEFADNFPYTLGKRYSVTVITKDPDSDIPDKIAAMPKCSFERHFTVNNLNHDLFNLYF